MGVRGEVFSNKVILPNRTYFFNVKENRMGDLYLNIVESKNRDSGGFDRQSVILFADDLQEFLKGFDESLRVLEKAARENRHSGKKREDAAARDQSPKGNFRASHSAKTSRPAEAPRERSGRRSENHSGDRSDGRRTGGSFPRERSEKRGGGFARGQTDGQRGSRSEKRGGEFSRGRDGGRGNKGRQNSPNSGSLSDSSRANYRKDRGGDYQPKNKKRLVVKKRD